jgi:hypothetical protein
MIWSDDSVVDGAKEGSCLTRSIFRVRLCEAVLRRQVRHMCCVKSADTMDGRRECDRRETDIVVMSCRAMQECFNVACFLAALDVHTSKGAVEIRRGSAVLGGKSRGTYLISTVQHSTSSMHLDDIPRYVQIGNCK